MSLIRKFLYVCYLMFSVAILLEVIFRFLPTSESLLTKPVNASNPYLRFEENRNVTRQIGFDFTHVNVKRVNNYGFVATRDFKTNKDGRNKVVAVIGDSQVEALQVSDADTFHAKIDASFDNIDVYPLGVSGSPMSQYIAYKNYVRNSFSPDLYVFLIVFNDFDESWYEFKKAPGYHYFSNSGGLDRVDYFPSKIKKLVRKSAFLRYLHLDLKLTVQLGRFFQLQTDADKLKLKSNNVIEARGKEAVNRFVKEIRDLATEKPVIVVLDGDRNSIYAGQKGRDLNVIRNRWFQYLFEKSQNIPNLFALDLHPVFQNDWDENKKKFNYEYDYHMNERGHAIAADALVIAISKIDI